MLSNDMNPSFNRSGKAANYLVALVLVLVPFHAFLTVWGSAILGHYTALRLWDDTLLLGLLGICCFWLLKDTPTRTWFVGSLLVRLILAYAGLALLLALVSYLKGEVTPKALAYGLLVNLRFLAWFLAVMLVTRRSPWLRRVWPRLLLIPAGAVIAFATLQYTVLPHNFLSHFGYDAATTIAPMETINHDPHYIRVQSTLRGANPLGAYLVIILSAIGTTLRRGRRKLICAVFGVTGLFALYASGSRSAWIGTLASLAVVAWFWLPTRRLRIWAGWVVLGVVALVVGLFLSLRHNAAVQNAVFHTQDNSRVAVSSNGAHASALKNGLRDTLRQPLGDGPGTAGPASEYNAGHPVRIAENYYIQIAQETGWLGLALLLSIFALVAAELYRQIRNSRLACILLASFIGIALVNMLSHAWVDDTLAFLWWGLAGIALGLPAAKPKAAKR